MSVAKTIYTAANPASIERQAAIINLSACDPSVSSLMFRPRGTKHFASRISPEGFLSLEMYIMSSFVQGGVIGGSRTGILCCFM